MVVRDGPDRDAPLQVLMVRRNLRSDFVGGAFVFPGGGVDADDSGSDVEARCAGRNDDEASELLGIPSGGLAYWVAALRECFEEAGLLLAYRQQSDEFLSLAGPRDAARFAKHRHALNTGDRRFLDVCAEEELCLAVDRVHYFAHWITPAGAPRRYDTRFFVAAAPPDQTPAHDEGETIDAQWVRPADALARHRDGEIELIFPTIRSLQAIGRFATAGELLAAAAAMGRIPVVEPRIVVDGNGVRILLPGDAGFDGVETPADAERPRDFNEAMRAISRAANPAPGGDARDATDPGPAET